ncbi:MAG: hypothetical protein P9L98_00240 [Candidatus Kaelpia imicola]|nr:hypothetical protein [Candidatus Kaelpia imicola]
MKIRDKISLYFLAIVSVFVIIASSIFYNTAKENLKRAIFEHLKTTAISRAHHIETFLEEREQAVRLTAEENIFKEFSGAIAVYLKAEELFKITLDRTGLGETGEIYLVNKDKYMISPSIFQERLIR